MKKNNFILVFGYFGFKNNQLDGQTVKTRTIYELVKNRYECTVKFADSQQFRYSLKSIISFFKDMSRCSTLIWLPAHNNLKLLFPFIWLWSKVCHFEIIYIVIGGWLSTILEKLPFHKAKLKKIKAILLENKLSQKELAAKYNYYNLDIIPNFREESPRPPMHADSIELKMVFMARINKMKGLDTIASIAHRLDTKNISLDFYGPIHEEDKLYFKTELLDKFPFIKYKGILQPDGIFTALSNYDVLLFPTHYFTEGFPGTIMDAYRSGIPVIATNWKHAREFIVNGESGFIVDFDNPEDEMVSAINEIYADRELLNNLKSGAYRESLKYTPDKAWKIIQKYID